MAAKNYIDPKGYWCDPSGNTGEWVRKRITAPEAHYYSRHRRE
jgi:hypothetical protein